MHQILFRLGLRPRSRWGAYNAPPNPLAGFKGLLLRRRDGRGRKGRLRGGKGGGNVEFHHLLLSNLTT